MAQKVTKFEYGRAYNSEYGIASLEENVVVSRTENSVLFRPESGEPNLPMFFRRKVKVTKLRDGRKVECCKARKRESGRIYASNIVEGYIDPIVKEPEEIWTEKPEEEDLPYYDEYQLIAMKGAKKFDKKKSKS